MNDNPIIPDDSGVTQRLAKLLQQLKCSRTPADRDLREVCGLFGATKKNLESFHELLLQQGLNPCLAGSIMALLKCEGTLAEFLKAEEPITWAEAMAAVWKFVAEQIRRILCDPALAENEKNQGRLCQLCQLAVQWGIDPESYRKTLVAAGLVQSRASEIKCVLECQKVRDELIKTNASLTWNDALRKARAIKLAEESDPGRQLKSLAQQLVRLIVRCLEPQSVDGLKTDALSVRRVGPGSYILELKGQGTLRIEIQLPA